MITEVKLNKIIPLIGSPSPRDIPDVKTSMAWIYDDKLLAKYFDEFTAYKLLRNFFLQYKKYTHLVIWPDDLVIEKEQYERLRKQAKNYPVFSGTCNKSWKERDVFVTCKELPSTAPSVYNYLTKDDLDKYKDNPVQQMTFEGFACCFIRRDVVEKIDFRGYKGGVGGERAFDYQFAEDCLNNNIPIMVDTSVRMLHLGKRLGDIPENWGIGFKTPSMVFEAVRGEINRTDEGQEEMIDSFADKVSS